MKQEMMKGKQRVKGSVLFTVVTVMLVMVLFLMSTLILTTSASRRSYYSYFQTQAQYAAQSALNAITNNAYNDSEFYDWLETVSAPEDIYVTLQNSHLNLTDDKSLNTDNSTGIPANASNTAQAMNNTVHCIVEPNDVKYVWDDVTKMIYPEVGWKISATAYVGAGRNQANATVVQYIYKNVRQSVDPDKYKNLLAYHHYDWQYEETEDEEEGGAPGSLAKAIYSLGDFSYGSGGHNISTYGPEYSGVSSIPVGRTNYNKNTTPTLSTQNDPVIVGSSLYVNNIKNNTKKGYVFQKKGENIQVWGNLYSDGGGFLQFVAKYEPGELPSPVPPAGESPKAGDKQWNYRTDLNAVYVDGTLYTGGNATAIGYDKDLKKGNMPVNLYAGAVANGTGAPVSDSGAIGGSANTNLAVWGDLYLYDPALTSNLTGQVSEDATAYVARFTERQVTKSNAGLVAQSVGGNIICNNAKLYIGADGKDTELCSGDLIITNPSCEIVGVGKSIKVGGRIISASSNFTGTAITAGNGAFYGLDNCSAYIQDEYRVGKKATGELLPEEKGTGSLALMPFAYRLDEIFNMYIRWDKAESTAHDEKTKIQATDTVADTLMKESMATGHDWYWKAVKYDESTYGATTKKSEKSLLASVKAGDEIPLNSEIGDIIKKEANYSPKTGEYYIFADWNSPIKITKNHDFYEDGPQYESRSKSETPTIKYVPYTTPVLKKSFLTAFTPVTSTNVSSSLSDQSTSIETSLEHFRTTRKTDTNNQRFVNENVTYYVHNPDGSARAVTVTAIVVTESCEIDVTKIPTIDGKNERQNGTVRIFVDPTKNGYNDSKPMGIIIKAANLDGRKIEIITNNTCQWDTAKKEYVVNAVNQTDPTKTEVAGRKEVEIFLQSGFVLSSGSFSVISSGLYSELSAAKTSGLNIISNPDYPITKDKDGKIVNNAAWWKTGPGGYPAADKYKYELVPNAVVLGQKDTIYEFKIQPFFNTEILMPQSEIHFNNATSANSAFKFTVHYREFSGAKEQVGTVTGGQNDIFNIGTAMVRELDLGQAFVGSIYIGDTGRSPAIYKKDWKDNNTQDEKVDEKTNPGNGKDYVSNDHLGAN